MFSTFVAAEPKKATKKATKKAAEPKKAPKKATKKATKKAVEPKKKKYTFKIIKLEKYLTELEALLPAQILPAQTTTNESKTDSASNYLLTELEALLPAQILPAQTTTNESKTDSASNYLSDLSGIVKSSLKYLKHLREYSVRVLSMIKYEFELDQNETERVNKPKKIIEKIIKFINDADKTPPNTDKTPPNTDKTPPNTDKTPPNTDKTPPNNIKVFSKLLEQIKLLSKIYKFRGGRNTPPIYKALSKIRQTEEHLLFYIGMIYQNFTGNCPNKSISSQIKNVIDKIIKHSDTSNVEKWTYPDK